ncbi:MAG: hypothetical protein AMS17_12870 [Spirochaetes bacterium DG_61]|nr:MAG: hypothetical protein AMS17_12870 [Spirochaetes bacterium DG_61]
MTKEEVNEFLERLYAICDEIETNSYMDLRFNNVMIKICELMKEYGFCEYCKEDEIDRKT